MIFCSSDNDPTNIIHYFGGLAVRIPLQYLDFAFWGVGPNRSSISIGIERKRLDAHSTDLIDSLITTKRLIQQIRDARQVHRVIYLIGEGRWRPGVDGLVEIPLGRTWAPVIPSIAYAHLDKSLSSLEIVEGIIYRRAEGPKETAQIVIDLYNWWQTAPEEHQTSRVFSDSVPLVGKMSLLRRIAKELPDVGFELSERVAQEFSSVQELVNAEERRWLRIKGIGRVMASRIVRAIEGNGNGRARPTEAPPPF